MILRSFPFFLRFDDLWLDMATSNNDKNNKKNNKNNNNSDNDNDNDTSSG